MATNAMGGLEHQSGVPQVTVVPNLARLLTFAVIALTIIVVPGPSVLFVVSRGVAFGRRVALTTVLGNETGLLLQVVAVELGPLLAVTGRRD